MNEKSPWITIWTSPKETIRKIVIENPKKSLVWLATIYGFSSLMGNLQAFGVSSDVDIFALTLFAIVLSPLFGYLVFCLWSWVVLVVGKIFKGLGDFQSVRAAYAWSQVPLAVSCAIWILLLFIFGQTLFMVPSPTFDQTFSIVLLSLLLVKVIMSVWSFVLYVNTLAEVQQFSALKALGNIVLAVLVMIIILSVISVIFVMITGADIDSSSSVHAAFELLQQSKSMLNNAQY